MAFCPTCRFEYKADLQECPDCGGELADELPQEAPGAGEDATALLCTVTGEIHAKLLMDALRSQGIPARPQLGGIQDSPYYLAVMPAPIGSTAEVTIRIYVRESDAERARLVYQDMERQVTEDEVGEGVGDDPE
jgi:hypothetical protein